MSKIYEALQRAEQERLARTGAPASEPSAAVPPPSLPAQPDPVGESTFQPVADMPPPVFAPIPDRHAYAEPSPLARPAQAHIFTAVVPTIWTPQLEKLPALHERGPAVEQFRSLRTRLFAFRDLNKLKSIMVSSGLPREGKSFIAANLAVSFARHKAARVLLIDGDMRRSSLHTLFGCQRSPGLSTYLAGQAELQDIMQRMQLPADTPANSAIAAGLGSLTFIGGGDEGDKAADLSGSKRFQELIERASEHFDWIIVDSSPVNLVTDGVNLAHACDAVLLVARNGVTRFEAAQRALVELKNSTILGVVLNAAEHKSKGQGYYGYDGYESYDGYDSDVEDSKINSAQETGQVAQ